MDATLNSPFYASLSFESLLPGLFKPSAQHRQTVEPTPRLPSAEAARACTAWRSADPTPPAPPGPLTPQFDSSSSSSSPSHLGAAEGAGMAKKRAGQRNPKHAKAKGKHTKQPAKGSGPRTGAVTGAARPHGVAHPAHQHQQGFGPFQPVPHAPKTAHRELPRVELETLRVGDHHPHGSPAYVSAPSSFHDNGYYHHDGPYDLVHGRIHPADLKDAEYEDDDDGELSVAFSDSPSFVYSDDDAASDELDDDDEGEADYSSTDGDGGATSKELEESDERRPFPDPRLSKQQKYLRRSDSDSKASPESDHAPTADTYVEAAAPWTPRSPLSPSQPSAPGHAVPSHGHAHYVPYLAAKATTAKIAASSASQAAHVHYAPVSGATYDDAAYASDLDLEDFDPLDGPYPRGRSKHPRLLWRSALDPGALAVLDAHHERLRGGPLPRLVLHDPNTRLSASGVEREREHAPGQEDEQVQERMRRSRRRDRGAPGRRTWSQAGRQWSREMESIGL